MSASRRSAEGAPVLYNIISRRHEQHSRAVLADQVIRLATRLQQATARYHAAVLADLHRPDARDDDLPF